MKKKCIHCKEEYETLLLQQKYCSKRCSKRNRNKKLRQKNNKIKYARVKKNKDKEKKRREQIIKNEKNNSKHKK